ncbi:MAG: cbb3-type cytochrome c oxidase N-terminal domain-containing protein [Verrucomicrobiota bacterium JB022]|nr:cbb3-type cytochrome c oxidase N-terminal domain-containing protein [Verrucomicrobiota bacterium JB022]
MSSAQPIQDPNEPPKRPHVYDGIEEYDNRLPNWWLWTFYLAIIFATLYWFTWYNTRTGATDAARIDAEIAKIQEAQLAAMSEINSETLWQMSQNTGFVAKGEEIFMQNCASCHKADLTGDIGLNLVDHEWKWGNTPMSVFQVVSEGSPQVPNPGMQSWKNQLGPQGISQVVAFVLSHHTPEEMASAATLNPPVAQ